MRLWASYLLSVSQCHKLAPYTEGKVRPKKEAGYSGWVGGIPKRLILGSCKASHLHTCLPILKSLYGGFNWLGIMYYPDGLNSIPLSQGGTLGAWGRQGECTFQGQGSGCNPPLAKSSSRANQPTCLLDDFFQHTSIKWGCGDIKPNCTCNMLSSVPGTL